MPVEWSPEVVIEAARRGALRGAIAGANIVRNEVLRRILEDAKTGRIYRRRGVEHQASAPGEAPASDTGTLVRGITVEVDEATLTVRITNSAEYAAALEFGTDKIEPRPHMRVSLAEKRAEVEAAVGREIQLELEQVQ